MYRLLRIHDFIVACRTNGINAPAESLVDIGRSPQPQISGRVRPQIPGNRLV